MQNRPVSTAYMYTIMHRTHMGRPYVYNIVPYAYGISHTCMGRSHKRMCEYHKR